MQPDPRVTAVIDNLSSLIVSNSRLLASEQYNPRLAADESDDYMKERMQWIADLRDIRERFENLVTGVVK
jgi:hypothetical protein